MNILVLLWRRKSLPVLSIVCIHLIHWNQGCVTRIMLNILMMVALVVMVMMMATMLELMVRMTTVIDRFTQIQQDSDNIQINGPAPMSNVEGTESKEVFEEVEQRPGGGFHDHWRNITKKKYETQGDRALHQAALLTCGFSKVYSVEMDTVSPAVSFTLRYRSDPDSEELARIFHGSRPSRVTCQELLVTLKLDPETNKFRVVERKFENIPGVLQYRVRVEDPWLWI